MIGVIDYGAGNMHNVLNALAHLGVAAERIREPKGLARAERIVFPGVGAFSPAVVRLKEQGLWLPLRQAAQEGAPFLGICLGFQMLFEGSEEGRGVAGFGLFPGTAVRFSKRCTAVKVPHIGWNTLTWEGRIPLLEGLPQGCFCYFVHSYAVPQKAEDKRGSTKYEVAWSEYGISFLSVVSRGRCFGVQFHPERSGTVGLKMLENFATRC